jgi:hypothetical protein
MQSPTCRFELDFGVTTQGADHPRTEIAVTPKNHYAQGTAPFDWFWNK